MVSSSLKGGYWTTILFSYSTYHSSPIQVESSFAGKIENIHGFLLKIICTAGQLIWPSAGWEGLRTAHVAQNFFFALVNVLIFSHPGPRYGNPKKYLKITFCAVWGVLDHSLFDGHLHLQKYAPKMKHPKNCECCPVSLLIVRSERSDCAMRTRTS